MVGPVPVLEVTSRTGAPARRDQELDDGRVQPVALGVLVGGDGLGQLADAGREVGQQPRSSPPPAPEVGAAARAGSVARTSWSSASANGRYGVRTTASQAP